LVRLPAGATTRVGEFDRRVDSYVERVLRNHSLADRVFYGASAVGDHGLVWMGLAVVQAVRHRRGDWPRPLLRAVIGLGVESVVVNGPLKWVFRRQRPVQVAPRPRRLRQPRSSSFPSGHASAAFFGAALLRDNDPWWPAYYLIAAVVAASRVHVRIHHASDVIGGVVTGVVLGEITRALLPVTGPARAAVDGRSGPPAAGGGMPTAPGPLPTP
jgi:undecaprenyl-diphosphatase